MGGSSLAPINNYYTSSEWLAAVVVINFHFNECLSACLPGHKGSSLSETCESYRLSSGGVERTRFATDIPITIYLLHN